MEMNYICYSRGMNTPYLFAFDLDGTTIAPSSRGSYLPEAMQNAIRTLAQEHHVTVLTGRALQSSQRFLDALGIQHYYATCQGALVHLSHQHKLREDTLPLALIEDLEIRFEDLFLADEHTIYARNPKESRWIWAHQEGLHLASIDDYPGYGAYRAVLRHPHLNEVKHGLIQTFPQFNYYHIGEWGMEVVHPGGNKGLALRELAKLYGVPQERVIAFGDGDNDIPMLQWAGHAVGVGHLAKGVREVIDEHIPGPENLGIVQWLRKMQFA